MHLPQPEQQVEVRFFLLVLILDINLLHNILFEVFSYNTLIKKQLAHHVFICFHCPISIDASGGGCAMCSPRAAKNFAAMPSSVTSALVSSEYSLVGMVGMGCEGE